MKVLIEQMSGGVQIVGGKAVVTVGTDVMASETVRVPDGCKAPTTEAMRVTTLRFGGQQARFYAVSGGVKTEIFGNDDRR